MLKIRLTRTGRKNDPHFRVVVIESHRAPKSGAFLEILGHHHPRQKQTTLEHERIAYWQSKGAQVSETVSSLLRKDEQEKNKIVVATPTAIGGSNQAENSGIASSLRFSQ